MDNVNSTPIDTASTQHSPDSTAEQRPTTPATAVGGDQQDESTTNKVVKENTEVTAA